MEKIYLAAYKHFGENEGDYKLLEVVCNRITNDFNKNDVTFFVTETSDESGDITCTKYVNDNGFKKEDWLPPKFRDIRYQKQRAGEWKDYYFHYLIPQKEKYIAQSDHVILVSDNDKDNKGIVKAMRLAGENCIKHVITLFPETKKLYVAWVEHPDLCYVYNVTDSDIVYEKTMPANEL